MRIIVGQIQWTKNILTLSLRGIFHGILRDLHAHEPQGSPRTPGCQALPPVLRDLRTPRDGNSGYYYSVVVDYLGQLRHPFRNPCVHCVSVEVLIPLD